MVHRCILKRPGAAITLGWLQKNSCFGKLKLDRGPHDPDRSITKVDINSYVLQSSQILPPLFSIFTASICLNSEESMNTQKKKKK